MKCESCNDDHDGSFGSGRFCSKSCANRRIHSEETKLKTSKSMKNAILEKRANIPKIENWEEYKSKRRESRNIALLSANFEELSFERLRLRIILEQKAKCNNCGLSEWLGKEITLELEHKDGNNWNNDRDNLEMLCPNCHSYTQTWRGRNKPSAKRSIISDEKIVKAFIETGNIRQCLLKLGLAAKGANYGRVKRALTLWGIEY